MRARLRCETGLRGMLGYMALPSPAPTLEEAITAALATGDEARAVVMLRRAFGRGAGSERAELPDLLEELAEYYLSIDRFEDAIAAASRALLVTARRESAPEVLHRRRCRIAEALLQAGLTEEAFSIYAAIAEEISAETCVHEAAGIDYLDAGDHELAFAWLTAGLELAIADGDRQGCAGRLLGLRRISMAALGLGPDELDRRASQLATVPESHAADVDDIILLDELDRDGLPTERVTRLLRCLRRAGDGGG